MSPSTSARSRTTSTSGFGAGSATRLTAKAGHLTSYRPPGVQGVLVVAVDLVDGEIAHGP